MNLKEKAVQTIHRAIATAVNAVAQTESVVIGSEQSAPALCECARKAAAAGMVLLKNKDGVLPFAKGTRISVYGRTQIDTFYVGYGSGGDVHAPYHVSILDGLRADGDVIVNEELAALYEQWCPAHVPDAGYWGHWPMSNPEMPLPNFRLADDGAQSDCAVVVIGRAAGEDRENTLTEGSYYLTKGERALLDDVTAAFDRVVVLLNIGSLMDLSWLEDYGDAITAAVLVWQDGMETGRAVADVLTGKAAPGGRLSDTVVRSYAAYPSAQQFGRKAYSEYSEDIFVGYRFFETFAPSQVLFPFGYGLSYTTFSREVTRTQISDGKVRVWVRVKNTGSLHSGSEVLQLYLRAPQGTLSQPVRKLAAFTKTTLLAPGEEEKCCLQFDLADCASYDDTGYSGFLHAWVLEAGVYTLYLGGDVRSAEKCRSFTLPKTVCVRQCQQAAAPDPAHPFERLVLRYDSTGAAVPMTERAPVMKTSLRDRILAHLPEDLALTGDLGYRLSDVRDGKVTMEAFVAQLSFDELEAISRGDYRMNSPLGAPGNAGAIGGVLPSLRDKGIPPVITTDGPSGIRLSAQCSLLPNGVCLACSFDTALVEELMTLLAEEMKARGSDILLAPGMNLHRNPLCGRNFEYFSEDPLLTGKIAAGYVRGVQSGGLSACPKHFACNNQETNRTHNDTRVSERALREIYLKGFEICVKEAQPKNIMTSYNKINGVWNHYNYDLCTTILRGDWGYQGCVMTDWWMRSDESHEFRGVIDQGYRVRAGVDVLMPGGPRTGKTVPDGTLKKSMRAENGVTFGELQRTAMHVLRMCLAVDCAANRTAESAQ